MLFKKSGFNENRFRVLLSLQILWLFIILGLGIWWGHLITEQSEQIYELSLKTGLENSQALFHKNKMNRMIYWELAFYFIFILGSSLLMFWLYWKDLKRTQGLAHFFTALTHEIKTPLTSIKLQAETLEDALQGNSSTKNLLHRLLEDTGRLENQVSRSLELARLEGGGKVFLQSIDLRYILHKTMEDFKENHPGRKINLFVNSQKAMPIQADLYSLETIFRNLFENTFIHNPDVDLQINIALHENENTIHLIYEDHGELKIDDERQLGTLFIKGPYSKGAGIGLYLMRLLMEKMNGSIEFIKMSSSTHKPSLKIILKFLKNPQEGL